MAEYTHEERIYAHKVIGMVDDNSKFIPLEKRTKEELIDHIRLQGARSIDNNVAHAAVVKAFEGRLKSARKAKNLANRRADTAESVMRHMLGEFSKFEIKEE